ncbi:uncharacterized protein [Glycine max]|uniref:uncharacterized protein n=1 Tax=Glycine max TaxID=3847 RepID=UPI001B357FF5|nr:uncharacterized protein LOC100820201 [Glycine max]
MLPCTSSSTITPPHTRSTPSCCRRTSSITVTRSSGKFPKPPLHIGASPLSSDCHHTHRRAHANWFMINPKQARKNKARIEGSICTSYIYRETTHFCSDYFNNFMKLKLKVFDQQGRPFRKEFIHWLTDEEKDPVHVHVLINCVEVKLYLE